MFINRNFTNKTSKITNKTQKKIRLNYKIIKKESTLSYKLFNQENLITITISFSLRFKNLSLISLLDTRVISIHTLITQVTYLIYITKLIIIRENLYKLYYVKLNKLKVLDSYKSKIISIGFMRFLATFKKYNINIIVVKSLKS